MELKEYLVILQFYCIILKISCYSGSVHFTTIPQVLVVGIPENLQDFWGPVVQSFFLNIPELEVNIQVLWIFWRSQVLWREVKKKNPAGYLVEYLRERSPSSGAYPGAGEHCQAAGL